MIQLYPSSHPFSFSSPFNGEAIRTGWPKRHCPLPSAPFISAQWNRVRALPFHRSRNMLSPRPPPISKLPVELLSIIFMLSREPEDDDPGSFDTSSVKTPLILSHVCRRWRNIARSIPRLWTQISISWDILINDDDPNPRIETNLITSYLALSKNCPLDIRIDVRDEDWDGTEPEIEYDDPDYDPASTGTNTYHPERLSSACSLIINSLPLLIPHLHRWGSLGILTDTWAPMFLALNLINPYLIKFGAPQLESLTLMRCNGYVCFNPVFEPKQLVKPEFLSRKQLSDDDANSVLNNGSVVDLLPRLKHLALMGVHVDWDALANAVETNQVGGLKTLSLRSLSKQVTPSRVALLRLLHASPSLESLVVNTAGPCSSSDSEKRDDLGRARLDKLQMLEIGYRSEEEAEALIGSISTSTAKEVVLKYEEYIPGDVENMDGELVLGYLAKTEAEGQRPLVLSDVEELRLCGVGFEDELMGREALKTVLAGATKLKRLNVVDMAVEDVLRSLVLEGTRHPCPELQSLTMKLRPSSQYMVVSDVCITVWMEMVRYLLGERRKISTLKEVIIEMESFAPDFVGRETATIDETFVSISVSKASMLDSSPSAYAIENAVENLKRVEISVQ